MKYRARTTKQLGMAIRRERRRQGLTQAELGRRIGMRQATISRLEGGEPAMQLQTLVEVLSALKLEIIVDQRGKTSFESIEHIF